MNGMGSKSNRCLLAVIVARSFFKKSPYSVVDKRNIEQEFFDEMEEDDFPTAHGDEQMLQEERSAL